MKMSKYRCRVENWMWKLKFQERCLDSTFISVWVSLAHMWKPWIWEKYRREKVGEEVRGEEGRGDERRGEEGRRRREGESNDSTPMNNLHLKDYRGGGAYQGESRS